MQMSALFVAKKLRNFWYLWCVRTDRGVNILRTRGGVNFSRFCVDVLWTAPKASPKYKRTKRLQFTL